MKLFIRVQLFSIAFLVFAIIVILSTLLRAQNETEVIRTIQYTEILNAQMTPIAGIERMKISANGDKIVFNTVGGQLYTINADGTQLTEILSQDGRGFIDINADGSFIIFAKVFDYEIRVFSSSGGAGISVANNLPLPGGGTTGPDIRLNPVIADSCGPSGLETRIFFTALAGGPDVAGVWSVGNDGTGLQQHFSYRHMSQALFGLDGSEYNGNVAFREGFDVSENGRRAAVGTFNFQPEGHTILWDETSDLQILKDFCPVLSNMPLGISISPDGNRIAMSKPINMLGAALIVIDLSGGSTTELMENIGTSPLMQITRSGLKVFVKGDQIGLTLFDIFDGSRLDLVNSPSLGNQGNPFYRNCIGPTISITEDGRRFAFVSALNFNDYTRLWVADIHDGAAASSPSITNVTLSPDYVVVNGGSFARFSAAISTGGATVLGAGFSGFNEGTWQHIIGNSNAYWLWDNGTHGDPTANDGIYNAESVWTSMLNNPDPGHPYMIRFSAYKEHRVSVVDVKPFYILNSPPLGVDDTQENTPLVFDLSQNYPNPFNPTTTIEFALPKSAWVTLKVYNLLGKAVATLVSEQLTAGRYQYNWNAGELTSGVYFYELRAGDFRQTRKLLLLR